MQLGLITGQEILRMIWVGLKRMI